METERLNLISFKKEHYEAIFKNDNIRLGQLLNVNPPNKWTTFDQAQNAIRFLYEIFKSIKTGEPWGSYFITLKQENELIGTCGFKGPPDNNNYVEIGYEINPAYHNKGLATQAAQALIDLAFSQNIKGVKAQTAPENSASGRVLKKCGFNFITTFSDPDEGPMYYWLLDKSAYQTNLKANEKITCLH